MLIAQITDFHITEPGNTACGGVDTAPSLVATVAALNALSPRPDLVLMTGDVVNHGRATEYDTLSALLEPLELPVRMLPGNHDDRANLRRSFAGRGWVPDGDGFIQYAIEDYAVRILMLDTLIPGRTEGELCPARLDWVATRLAEQPGRPTMIAMHHPPFLSGMVDLDKHRCAGHQALGALVAAHPNVLGVVTGHLHRPVSTRWAGTLGFTCPSTSRQMALTLDPGNPFGWTAEPPAFALHLYREAEGLVSLPRAVGL